MNVRVSSLEERPNEVKEILKQQEEPNRLSIKYYGEFDPGSGRTLAACLTHASRTGILFRQNPSGERVSNA